MMLSMFHHHEHNQHNNQDRSSADERRPLSSDLASTGSSSGAHSDYGQTNSSPPLSANGGGGDVELQPQDLSLRPKRQEDSHLEAVSEDGEYPCQLCSAVLIDQMHLIQHVNQVHGGNGVSESKSPTESLTNAPQSSIFPNGGGVSMARQSNGVDTQENEPTDQSLQCPLCNATSTNEADFFEHFLRHHSNENGPDSMTSLLTSTGATKNGNLGMANGGSNGVDEGAHKTTVYCDICNKEFCNSWFLKTHKAKVHGVTSDDTEDHRGHHSNNGDASHPSTEHTPKTSPASSVFDPASNFGNPMATLPFGAFEQQQQLAAFGQQQNVCPFCHQFFPNPIILQSHLLTTHSGLLMNPAAAMYAASMMSANPLANGAFFQQQQPNGKNLQQQQQMAAMAAAAAMLGFGATPATDPMTAAMAGPSLDYFTQGMQQAPIMMQPNLGTTPLGPASMKGTKSSQHHFGMGIGDEDKPVQQTPTKNMEAYCEICQKEFCNKYFLRTHKMNKHGILDDSPKSNGQRSNTDTNKSPGTTSPGGHRLNGKDSSNDLKRDSSMANLGRGSTDEDDGTPVSKMAKLVDAGTEPSSSAAVTSASAQFPCNLCVKAFPSMFALVAHKYRDHGTFDGATASALVNQTSTVTQPTSTSPTLGFGQVASQRQQRKSLENELAALSSPIKGIAPGQTVDLEAYCEICQKEFCSKYFLKVHKANIHGIGSVTPNSSPSMVTTNGSGAHVPLGVRRSLNGSISNGSPAPMNLTGGFKDQENGRRNSTNGAPTSAAAILMMAAAGGVPSGMSLSGRPLVASKNFCDICNKELCNKYFLRTHMLKMHGIVIDENKTVIANINTLDKEKNGELLFRCDLCGEQLASRQQLRAHKQSVHQIVVPSGSSSAILAPSMGAGCENSMDSQQGMSSGNSIKRESIDDLIDSLAGGRHGKEDQEEDEGTKGLDFTRTPTGLNGSDGKDVLCTICGNKYKNARCLRMHILSDHAGIGQKSTVRKNGPTCEYCSMEFPDHTELQLHVINEHQHEVRGSVASMAEQAALDALSNSSAFVAAVNSVANAVAEVAAAAGNTNTPSTPLESMENEVDTTPVQQQHSELPLVTRSKNGTKLFRCSYCNYYTRWISNLSTHEKRHNVGKPIDAESGEKPFKCRMCLRSYRYSHSLQRHMEVHRSSAIGLRTPAINRPSPPVVPNIAAIPPPPYQSNDAATKTPPALTPGPNGHDHTATEAFPMPPPNQNGFQNGDHGAPINLTMESKPNSIVAASPDKRHHCHLCGKAFGNRELYRMHVLTIHNTAPSPDKLANGNASPKRAYRCRMCHFVSSKSFDDLRMHMFQKHSTTPAYMKSLTNGKDAPEQSGHEGHSDENGGEGLDLTAKNGDEKNGGTKPNCIMQPFLMQEKCDSGIFPTSAVVYLPVLHRVESPIEASFVFTPIGADHGMENGTNGHA